MGGVLHNTHTQSCAGIYWNIMTTMDRETQANIVFFSETRNYPVKFVCLTVFYHSWWHQGAYPTCLSLQKLYGGLRLLREFPLYGWQLWGKFLLVRTFSRWITLLWVGVVCANVVRRRWTIIWYIVVWHLSCGVMYLGPLGFSGYYR